MNPPAANAPVPSASAPSDRKERAFDLSIPKTAEELLATEIRCNRKTPEDCERAAEALAIGKTAPPDEARAVVLRRIALTLYVKQCEGSRALACARLSEMYAEGHVVQQNLKNAAALRDRFAEICQKRPDQPGCSFR